MEYYEQKITYLKNSFYYTEFLNKKISLPVLLYTSLPLFFQRFQFQNVLLFYLVKKGMTCDYSKIILEFE